MTRELDAYDAGIAYGKLIAYAYDASFAPQSLAYAFDASFAPQSLAYAFDASFAPQSFKERDKYADLFAAGGRRAIGRILPCCGPVYGYGAPALAEVPAPGCTRSEAIHGHDRRRKDAFHK
jgi:hypothetical protein